MKARVRDFTMSAVGKEKSSVIVAQPPDTRITRAGDTRITRAGDTRVIRINGYSFSLMAGKRSFMLIGWNNNG
jgi:hypothetical protein